MNTLTLAAAHVAPVFMDTSASVEKAVHWIKKAGQDGADIVVFPEVFLPGFPYWINCYAPLLQGELTRRYQDLSIEEDGPEVKALRQAAKDAGMVVVMGASERGKQSRTCYNSSLIFNSDGSAPFIHRKLKPTFAERTVWGEGGGDRLGVVPTSAGRVGALACWEHTMNLARQALAEQNMEIHAALWPALDTMVGFDQIANLQIQAMMQNHALTAQCFVISAASPVTQEMLDYLEANIGPQEFLSTGGGWSAIIHPFGPILAGPVTGLEEQLVMAEVDMSARADTKMWVDGSQGGHYSRPDVLRLVHENAPDVI
ncbi:MAG: carbon-nitrogen hydrolase family protein [Pseudomonadota bacterium]